MVLLFAGLALTYVISPLSTYYAIRAIYDTTAEGRFRLFLLTAGFGPISISLLLFVLLQIAPGRSDRFYIVIITVLVLLPLLPPLWRAVTTFGASAWHVLSVALPRRIRSPVVRHVAVSIARLLSLGTGLWSFFAFFLTLRSEQDVYVRAIFDIATAIGSAILIVAAGRAVWLDFVTIADAMVARRRLPISQRSATPLHRLVELSRRAVTFLYCLVGLSRRAVTFLDSPVVSVGAILAVLMLVLIVGTGLMAVLVSNDPIEYAMVARAIYDARSLDIYPILTGLPGSGLFAPSAHPPAFHLLHVWSYMFDGSEATRMLRVSPLFYLIALLGIVYAVLARFGQLTAVVGMLLILSVPYLPYLAAVSHIDAMRTFFFVLSLILVADVVQHPAVSRAVFCGLAIGFCLYSHSLGLILGFISGSAYLVLARTNWQRRLGTAALIATVAAAIGGLQYIKNVIRTGLPAGDSLPVWNIAYLQEIADLASRRNLATLPDIVTNGILRNFLDFDLFGIVSLLTIAVVSFRWRYLWRHDVTRVALFAAASFYLIIILITATGSLEAVKNLRYAIPILPVLCIVCAAGIGDLVSRQEFWTSSPAAALVTSPAPAWRSHWTQGFILAFLISMMGRTVAVIRNHGSYLRSALVWEAREKDFVKDPAFAFGPGIRLLNERASPDARILVFRQAEFSFFGTTPWLDSLDTALLPFYAIRDKATAYRYLIERKIRYFYVPSFYLPTQFYNSQAAEIAADPGLAELIFTGIGTTIYRLRNTPQTPPCQPIAPATVAMYAAQAATDWPLVNEALRWLPAKHRVTAPTLHREMAFTLYAASAAQTDSQTTDLTSVVFLGLHPEFDATSSQQRRIHVLLEVKGEGIADILMRSNVDQTLTSTNPARRGRGSMSLWGVDASFDEAGQLFYNGRSIGQVRMREPVDLVQAAGGGEPITFSFDPKICTERDLGDLLCGTDYQGVYDAQANLWTVTGPVKSTRRTESHAREMTERKAGTISIWGILHSFNDRGDLFAGERRVGRVRSSKTATGSSTPGLLDWASDGKPVTVGLNEDSCRVPAFSSFVCGADYDARLAPDTQHWTVTGPIHQPPTAAATDDLVWNGLLQPSARQVAFQALVSQHATSVDIIVKKPVNNVGSLTVTRLNVCSFQGGQANMKPN